MKTVRDVLNLSTQYLEQRGIERARREAENLLCDALATTRIGLYTDLDRPLQESELTLCRSRLARRSQGEPNAYIHGSVEFYDCVLEVNPNVLIPRQETALLVDHIAQVITQSEEPKGQVLWDVCCGSGCIGISLKKRFPQLEVIASDLSPEAVAITKRNAVRNQVEIAVLEGDLLQPFHDQRCHFFVCNPPYISEEEYASLSPEVRDHEPRLALVGGSDGLEFYRRLASTLKEHLHPQARAYFELGTQQGSAIQRLFNEEAWKSSRIVEDWAGHQRFFFLENE